MKKKKCRKCNINQELACFYKNISSSDNLRSECKLCCKEASRKKYKKNKTKILNKNKEWWNKNGKELNDKRTKTSKHKRASKNNHLKRTYNITIEEYEEMNLKQKGECAICNKHEKNRALAVDHCHVTGKIRGLLCLRCNTKLGWYENNNTNINDYLEGKI